MLLVNDVNRREALTPRLSEEADDLDAGIEIRLLKPRLLSDSLLRVKKL